MASNSVIGALRVVLGADASELGKGLKKSQADLAAFGERIKTAMIVASGAAVTAATAIGAAVKSTIDQFDNLSKTSQKIGVPVQELSALRHAAELSDVSMESLEKGVGRLARNLVEGAQGLQTPVRAFEALGISIRNADGSIKTVSQALPEIADKFAQMKDGPEKTALSMQLLGRAGADLIPMLNGGAAGLKELTDEAASFGLVISTDTAQTAEAFNDNLTRLHAILNGVFTQLTANILPTLARFSQFLVDSAKNSGFLQTAAGVLTTAFNGLARAAVVIYDNIGLVLKAGALFIGAQIGAAAISFGIAFVKMASAIRATTLVMGAFEIIRGFSMRGLLLMAGIVAMASGAFDGFSEKISKVGDWISKFMPEGAGEKAKKVLEGLGLNLDGLTKDLKGWQNAAGKDGSALFNPKIVNDTKNALDQYLSSQRKHIASLEAEAQTVGKSSAEQAKMRVEMEARAIATEKQIPLTAALAQKIAQVGDAAAAAALKLQGAQLIEQTANPWEQRAQKLQEYTNAMTAAGATAAQLSAMNMQVQFPSFTQAANAAADFGMQVDQFATNAVNGLSNTLAGLITGTKDAAQAFKEFAASILADLAAMIVKMLIFKAIKMALGFGFFADGGPVGGTGLSLTATGGLYASGGPVFGAGTATSDSIPAMLSDGEFVINAAAAKKFGPLLAAINNGTIPKFSSGGMLGERVSRSSESFVPAVTQQPQQRVFNVGVPNVPIGREALRSLFEQINEIAGDGFVLKVAAA